TCPAPQARSACAWAKCSAMPRTSCKSNFRRMHHRMSSTDKYTVETITDVRPWTDSLFSFRTTRDRGYRFVPGQFARLGVNGEAEGSIVWRAYSIASAAHDEHLEFFSVVVPNGQFTSRLSKLKEGDPIYVERKSYGFLTTDRFESGRDLWMLATGTGLAPFLSSLHDFATSGHS